MAVKLSRRLLSTEEYHSMARAGILLPDEKVELIRGEIITRSPIGNKHVYIVNRLAEILYSRIIGKAIISIQNPIRLDSQSEPKPDFAILKRPVEKYKDNPAKVDNIHLLIEVSGSSWEYDKEVKLPLYARAGITELWLINLEKEEIELHQIPQNGTYLSQQIFKVGEEIPLRSFDVKLWVEEIFG